MLIESLPDQRFDDGLTAHIQVPSGFVQFLQHVGGKVDIHALNRLDHAAFTLEKARDILAPISHLSDLFGCHRFR
jgi:hypothetical protein